MSHEFCSWLTQIRGNLPLTLGDYDYVSNGEFLKILVFSDRTEKRNLVLVFQSWKITMDHYSYLITLQAFRKAAHLLIKNSPMIRI